MTRTRSCKDIGEGNENGNEGMDKDTPTNDETDETPTPFEKAERDLQILYDRVERCTTDERPIEIVLALKEELKEGRHWYESQYEICKTSTDTTSVEFIDGLFKTESDRANRYENILNAYVTKLQGINTTSRQVVSDERIDNTNRNTTTLHSNESDASSVMSNKSRRSVASSATSRTSRASINSRAKQAKRNIEKANLEVELAKREAEFNVLKAKMKALQVIDVAEQQLDEAEAELEELNEVSDSVSMKSIEKSVRHSGLSNSRKSNCNDNAKRVNKRIDADGPRLATDASAPSATASLESQAIQEAPIAVQRLSMANELPDIEIKKFAGEYTEYPRFICRFNELVMNRPLNESQKMSRLVQFLEGPARRAIECLETSGPGKLEKALSLLKKRFGKPLLIVRSTIKSLTEGPSVRANDPEGFQAFADKVRSAREILASMDCLHKIDENHISKIIDKTPTFCSRKWSGVAIRLREEREPTVDDLLKFLETEVEAATDPVYGSMKKDTFSPSKSQSNAKPTVRFTTLATQGKSNTQHLCPCCNESHTIRTCPQFKSASYEQRIEIARASNLCFRCLYRGHFSRDCTNNVTCKKQGCNQQHLTLMHRNDTFRNESDNDSVDEDNNRVEDNSTVASVHTTAKDNSSSQAGSGKTLMQVVPVKLYGSENKVVTTYALLDSASEVTLCEQRIADELNIKGVKSSLKLSTVTSKGETFSSLKVDLKVSRLHGNVSNAINLDSAYTIDNLDMSARHMKEINVSNLSYVNEIDLEGLEDCRIGLLIGADFPEALIAKQFKRGNKGEPWAVQTILGWSLVGPTFIAHGSSKSCKVNNIRLKEHDDLVQLNDSVQKFWSIDSYGTTADSEKCKSVEDERALTMMKKSIRLVEGSYEIGLPWKDVNQGLPNNLFQAKQRLNSLKRRLTKDEDLKQKYKTIIDDYLLKGIARPLLKDENQLEKRVWYLPHHPVINPTKKKIRIVFDAAAKYGNASLNGSLLQGPDLTISLIGVLLRFREGPFALVSDIEGMFLKVKVPDEDCHALRFLWWKDGNLDSSPEQYQMTRHIFGATSSPSCASFALHQTAMDHCEEYSEDAIQTVLKNFFVDDCLKSLYNEKWGVSLAAELRALLNEGSFPLTKWASNSKLILQSISPEERAAPELNLDLEAFPIDRTLGVQWDANDDTFSFKSINVDKPCTKRGLLSVTSSLYDPLGFVGPFVFTAKKLIQSLWKLKLDWDEELPEPLQSIWNQWKRDLSELTKVRIQTDSRTN